MKYTLIIASLLFFGAGCAGGSSTKPFNTPVPNSNTGAQSTSQATDSPREIEVRIDSDGGDIKVEQVE